MKNCIFYLVHLLPICVSYMKISVFFLSVMQLLKKVKFNQKLTPDFCAFYIS